MRDVGVPYDIGGDGHLVVGSDELSGTLTLEPNVALLFEQGMSLDVDINGVLDAQGTSSAPVVFGSAAEIPSAGDWIGIYFWGPPVTESTLDNVRIEHALTLDDELARRLGATGLPVVTQPGFLRTHARQLVTIPPPAPTLA